MLFFCYCVSVVFKSGDCCSSYIIISVRVTCTLSELSYTNYPLFYNIFSEALFLRLSYTITQAPLLWLKCFIGGALDIIGLRIFPEK